MIYEIYWPEPTELFPVREYRSAGSSPYGQHHNLTECKEYYGQGKDHYCYMEADSTEEAMEIAHERHPDWKLPHIWLGPKWWEKAPYQ